jgi:hypothetical protein
MFNSTVLEVAIGLVFCFASVSLITSSIYEAISSYLNLRSTTLLSGIQSLLNAKDDPKTKVLTENQKLLLGIYNHALASPLGNGEAKIIKDIKNKPSYIDPKHFALAMIETIQNGSSDFQQLGRDINAIQDDQIRKLLQGIYDKSAGDIDKIRSDLASWFDAGMDRVSGSYKRWSQCWCFVIAFIVAGAFNIDSFTLFDKLWEHPALVEQISVPAANPPATIDETIKNIKTLPIGWAKDKSIRSQFEWIFLTGWLVTASASLFGGPFWFDILKTLINLRGTGAKPKPEAATNIPVNTEKQIQPKTEDGEVLSLRNSLIALHIDLNKQDESYKPIISSEERW